MARGKQIIVKISKSTSECLDIFIKHCQTKNLSPETIKTYRYECEAFIKWYKEEQEKTDIEEITADTIGEYIIFLQEKGISQTYIATKLRQLRAFLYFCMDREYLEKFTVTIPKADEVIKEPYTQKELERLIKKPTSANWVEWRCWAMVNYLLSTGNRLATVLNVKIEDVDFVNNLIKLNKLKNRKQQYIPMSSGLKDVLKTYLRLWEHTDTDYLFPEYEGKQLSTRGAQWSIRNYNLNRGVMRTSIHLFRHTYAKYYIVAGGEATHLQRLLGHSTLAMTNHYINLYSTDLQKNYDKFNPLDNLTREMA